MTSFETCLDYLDWEPDVHGILMSFEDFKGVVYGGYYLPNVSIEYNWTKDHTIDMLIRKTGYRGLFDAHFKKSRVVLTRFQTVHCTRKFAEVFPKDRLLRVKGI